MGNMVQQFSPNNTDKVVLDKTCCIIEMCLIKNFMLRCIKLAKVKLSYVILSN